MNIFCMYRDAFLRGIYCTVIWTHPLQLSGNEIKADQQLTAGADPPAIESPVKLNSSNAARSEGLGAVDGLLSNSARVWGTHKPENDPEILSGLC